MMLMLQMEHLIQTLILTCYEKGEIDRKINSLKQLDNTYFTVEQIKSPIGGRFKNLMMN